MIIVPIGKKGVQLLHTNVPALVVILHAVDLSNGFLEEKGTWKEAEK